jgi:dTMP kinase
MTGSNQRHPGLFITFEGGEGAGKTTVINNIQEKLTQKKQAVVTTREPGGSALGNQIRQWLLVRDNAIAVGQEAELLLFLAARAQHLEELIKPALMAGKIVLCDRFNDSTIAYQGAARGLGIDYVQGLCEQVCRQTLPDITFYLDIDPTVGLQRRLKEQKSEATAGELDRIESEAITFHRAVRDGFLLLARQNPSRIQVVDASKPLDHVLDQVWGKISEKIKI